MQLIDARLRVGSAPVKICIQTSSWKWSSSYSSLLSGLKKIKIYYTLLIFQIFDGGAAARNSSRNVILLLIHLEGCCGREGIFRAPTWPFLSWWPLPHKSGQYYEGSISANHMLSISVLSVFLGTGRKKKKREKHRVDLQMHWVLCEGDFGHWSWTQDPGLPFLMGSVSVNCPRGEDYHLTFGG